MKNWVYYMREGIKNMWKKKVVPDYRMAEKKWRKRDAIELLEEIDPHCSKSFDINEYGDDDWANPEEVEDKK